MTFLSSSPKCNITGFVSRQNEFRLFLHLSHTLRTSNSVVLSYVYLSLTTGLICRLQNIQFTSRNFIFFLVSILSIVVTICYRTKHHKYTHGLSSFFLRNLKTDYSFYLMFHVNLGTFTLLLHFFTSNYMQNLQWNSVIFIYSYGPPCVNFCCFSDVPSLFIVNIFTFYLYSK